jgi:hypothetical protein
MRWSAKVLGQGSKRVGPESLFQVSAALLCTAELSILDHPGSWAKAAAVGAPDFWIEFREPLVVRGILGVERRVRFVGLAPDDPDRFQRLVTERIGGGVLGPG